MDVRLCVLLQGLSLLLLLVHASYACTKTNRDSPTSSPRHQHHHHVQHHQQLHRPSRQLQRQSRGLSEFLVPPPAPANFRGPRGPLPLHPPKNNNHNQPPPPPLPPPPLSPPSPPQHTRNGRYVNQQGGNGGNNNNGPGYFSKLMGWLNPFIGGGSGNNNDAIGKDSVGQGGSNYPKLQPPPPPPQQPVAQYAPQQPYTGGTGQYEPPPHPANLQSGYSNLAPWMNGKPCNPCNQIPWIPVLGASSQHNSNPGQYAANAGGGSYLPPPPPQEVKTPDFSHSVPPGNQQNYPIPNPHLYPGVMPPLFKAKPFNVAPEGYQPPNLDQPHSPNFEHTPSGLDHQPSHNFDQPPPLNFDHLPPSNYDHPPQPNFNQQPSQHFDQFPPNLDQPPQSNYNQPPPNFDLPTPSNFDHPPSPNFNHNQSPQNFDHPPSPNFNHNQSPQNFDHPPSPNYNHNQSPQNFDHPPSPNFNHNQSPQNFDHPPDLNFDYQSSNSNHPPENFNQQPPEIIEDQPPPNFDHQSPNYDYNGASDYSNQHPSNDDDQHPPSNFEQHHQPSQIVDVVKEAPTDLDHSDINDHNHQEPDHAESRPVYVNSAKSTSSPTDVDHRHHQHRPTAPTTPSYQESYKGPIVHFQRSPLIDLSNIGESVSTTTTTPSSSSSSSSSGGNRFLDSRPTDHIPVTIVPSKGKPSGESATLPSATLIDYIVSGANAESFSSSEEEKETRPPPRLQNERNTLVLPSATTTTTTTTTSSTTTQRVTTRPVDQRRQESLIETLVQSYEFFKKRNNETLTNEVRPGGRFYNETEDSSASREVVVPSKSENGKKIIIPYTSQYTPSPFHSTKSVKGHHHNHIDSSAAASNHQDHTTIPDDSEDSEPHNVEDNVVIQESRRVSVTRTAPKDDLKRLRNDNKTASAPGNSIDVHRLQKNIDNWTIQEYSKPTTSVTNSPNSTYPRWLSSKQIPDEYLLSPTEYDDSNESYDFSNDTELHRRTNKSEVTTSTHAPDSVTIVEAIYPKNPKKPELPPKRHSLNTSKNSTSSEKVYVVTPVPNPNSLEDLDEASSKDSSSKSSKSRKPKHKEPGPVERAYQVLPQAVNSLAVLANAPESAAPALWGIMEHEEFAQSANQPRWRSDADELPEPASTPILYSGHSKVSRAR